MSKKELVKYLMGLGIPQALISNIMSVYNNPSASIPKKVEKIKSCIFNDATRDQVLNKLFTNSENLEFTKTVYTLKKEKKPNPANPFHISKLEKYDVIKTHKCNFGTNKTPHWCVVYKVIDDMAYCVVLTTKTQYGKFLCTKSKMFNGAYYCGSFSMIHISDALKSFEFVLDAKKEFDSICSKIKKQFVIE